MDLSNEYSSIVITIYDFPQPHKHSC